MIEKSIQYSRIRNCKLVMLLFPFYKLSKHIFLEYRIKLDSIKR